MSTYTYCNAHCNTCTHTHTHNHSFTHIAIVTCFSCDLSLRNSQWTTTQQFWMIQRCNVFCFSNVPVYKIISTKNLGLLSLLCVKWSYLTSLLGNRYHLGWFQGWNWCQHVWAGTDFIIVKHLHVRHGCSLDLEWSENVKAFTFIFSLYMHTVAVRNWLTGTQFSPSPEWVNTKLVDDVLDLNASSHLCLRLFMKLLRIGHYILQWSGRIGTGRAHHQTAWVQWNQGHSTDGPGTHR